MKDLMVRIINDEELSSEDKGILIEKVVNAGKGIDRFITPGLYLHTDCDEKTDKISMQLWYRNVDDSGMTMHGPTNYNVDMIVELMKDSLLNKKTKSK